MTRINWIAAVSVAGLALAAAASGQAAASTAGVFQFVTGEVRVLLAAGTERPARKGAPLSVGDTVATARGAVAQIKMGDGAIVVVQPESRLTVAEFRYAGREDGSEKVVYRLERGGFRAITGAIGRSHKDNYLIETPIAHMGVRGTDHESYYLPAAVPGNGEPARPGVYNKVNVGLAFIRTQSGEVLVRPNQVGYAASAQDAPALLPAVPGFFNRAIEPRSAQLAPLAASPAVLADAPVLQTVGTVSGFDLSNPPAGSATPGTGSVVAYAEPVGGANFGRSGANLAIAANGAALANAGGDAAFGVDWGSWQGGAPTVGGNPTTGPVHFAESTMLTSPAQLAALPPALVSATYSYLGGPAPTNHLGAAGAITALSVSANFSTQTITNYSVAATVDATNWNASGSGSFAQFGGSGIAISGSCAGCAGGGTPAANGTAHGAFVGGAAERMITSFGLKAANQALSGAAYLGR